jgi:hypothetical protein
MGGYTAASWNTALGSNWPRVSLHLSHYSRALAARQYTFVHVSIFVRDCIFRQCARVLLPNVGVDVCVDAGVYYV